MVLVHALHALARGNGWQLCVAHFNHHLRGAASEGDERLVRQTARKLHRRCFVGGADVKAAAEQGKISLEMAARKFRHEFLARTAREQNAAVIALAHHADDQVELFFLRLLRGAGGDGLGGMKWRSPSPADAAVELVRPLLGFSKAELLKFAREHRIRFRQDATNFLTDIPRNRIRGELLPLLRDKYQSGLDKAILRLMDIVGAESEFVGAAAREFLERKDRCFEGLPLPVQRRVILQQLTELGIAPDFELIEQLRGAPGKKVSLSRELAAIRSEDGRVCRREETPDQFKTAELRIDLSHARGKTEFSGREFIWRLSGPPGRRLPGKTSHARSAQALEIFDAEKIGGEIVLRHWQPGDRFQPIGLKSAVKLQDLFINAKIPANRRRELVLAATSQGTIFWVENLRIGEACKLRPGTRKELTWQMRLPRSQNFIIR